MLCTLTVAEVRVKCTSDIIVSLLRRALETTVMGHDMIKWHAKSGSVGLQPSIVRGYLHHAVISIETGSQPGIHSKVSVAAVWLEDVPLLVLRHTHPLMRSCFVSFVFSFSPREPWEQYERQEAVPQVACDCRGCFCSTWWKLVGSMYCSMPLG